MLDGVYSGGQLHSGKKRFMRHQDAIPGGYKPSALAMPAPDKALMLISYEINQLVQTVAKSNSDLPTL